MMTDSADIPGSRNADFPVGIARENRIGAGITRDPTAQAESLRYGRQECLGYYEQKLAPGLGGRQK